MFRKAIIAAVLALATAAPAYPQSHRIYNREIGSADKFVIYPAAPSSPTNGDVYYDKTANLFKFRQNGAWEVLGGGGGGGGVDPTADNTWTGVQTFMPGTVLLQNTDGNNLEIKLLGSWDTVLQIPEKQGIQNCLTGEAPDQIVVNTASIEFQDGSLRVGETSTGTTMSIHLDPQTNPNGQINIPDVTSGGLSKFLINDSPSNQSVNTPLIFADQALVADQTIKIRAANDSSKIITISNLSQTGSYLLTIPPLTADDAYVTRKVPSDKSLYIGETVCVSNPGTNGSANFYAEVPDVAAHRITGNLTIIAWVRLKTYGTGKNTITIRDNNSAGALPWFFSIYPTGLLALEAYGGTGSCGLTSANTVPLSCWTQVAVRHDSSNNTVSFFLNGQKNGGDQSCTYTGPTSTGMTTRIGMWLSNQPTYEFGGDLCDVAIFNAALDDSEIGSYYTSLIPTNHANLVGFYKLNEGSGSTMIDSSATATNGSYSGVFGWASRSPL